MSFMWSRIGPVVWMVAVAALGTNAAAQSLPWLVFEDDVSASACDAVNAENGELVVLADTQELVLVSGSDVILDGTFVELDGFGPPWFVFFFNDPAGFVDFATDGDGFRTLWWLGLNGSVVRVNQFTGEPEFTNTFPIDFVDVPCDAAPLWDGCVDDTECDDGNPCTEDLCNEGFCAFQSLDGAICSDGDSCTRQDTCVAGVCEGVPILDCNGVIDGGGGGEIIINLCGTNMAVTLTLTIVGLWLTGLTRRRLPAPARVRSVQRPG